MKYLGGSLKALGNTFKNFFRPVITEGVRDLDTRADRYRASFCLTHDEHGEENCIGCQQCEKICPSRIITVIPAGRRESPITGKKRGYCDDFTLDMQACLFCELCVQVCPTDSIVMLKVQEEPCYSRDGLFLNMAKLYQNEVDHPIAWANGTNLCEMQNPKRGQPKKVKPPKKAAAKPTPKAAKPTPNVAEPAAKPAVEPAAKPAIEPAAKPTIEPAAKPAIEPAAAADLPEPAADVPEPKANAAEPAPRTEAKLTNKPMFTKLPPRPMTAKPQAPDGGPTPSDKDGGEP